MKVLTMLFPVWKIGKHKKYSLATMQITWMRLKQLKKVEYVDFYSDFFFHDCEGEIIILPEHHITCRSILLVSIFIVIIL